jgi:ubiquinone/menaquinone biosynthesis C-methylase UbiE
MKYLVDGRYLTKEEVISTFSNEKLTLSRSKRVVFELVENTLRNFGGSVPKYIDVGCYFGMFVRAVSEAFPYVESYGVDYFDDYIKIAHLLDSTGRNYLRMNAYELEFPDDYFDIVTLLNVIEHLDRPVDAIREINRVMKIEGTLLISTPNAVGLNNVMFSIFREYRNIYFRSKNKRISAPHEIFFENEEWNRHIYSWTTNTLGTLLLCNGFSYAEHRIVGEKWWSRLVPGVGNILIFCAKKTKRADDGVI